MQPPRCRRQRPGGRHPRGRAASQSETSSVPSGPIARPIGLKGAGAAERIASSDGRGELDDAREAGASAEAVGDGGMKLFTAGAHDDSRSAAATDRAATSWPNRDQLPIPVGRALDER